MRAEIVVMPRRGGDTSRYEVTLGETFPVGEETWRFADLDMTSADEWQVKVRRVDEDEVMEPPTGHLWKRARLRPYGQLDEAQLQSVEAALGHPLPPDYRDWLRRNNGALPEVEHHIPGAPFSLLPERPLFGMHPQYPPFDLVHAQRVHRDPWLSPAWLVIANPFGGLLVVSTQASSGNVYFVHELDLLGPPGPPASAARERKLRAVAWSMGEFLGRLTPKELDDQPPVQLMPPGTFTDPRNYEDGPF
ncbi:SMI1/KNR4 family protein [Micromonospora zingiberis]|uniref:SMI1/KNR4 family protein n=1 Tax=Micromonospora zingiberis TaxID=2053011 RepID=A0A4R0G4Q0_9ACTN|nr:SMI1/KNR4 family protein [Micromonospora zingiberis]